MLQHDVFVLVCTGEWRHVRSTQCVIGRHMGELSRGPECRSFGFAAGGGVRAERGEDTLLRECKMTKMKIEDPCMGDNSAQTGTSSVEDI